MVDLNYIWREYAENEEKPNVGKSGPDDSHLFQLFRLLDCLNKDTPKKRQFSRFAVSHWKGPPWKTFFYKGLDSLWTCHNADANDDEQIEGGAAHDGAESNNQVLNSHQKATCLGPRSPASKLLPKISMTERRISGAEEPLESD